MKKLFFLFLFTAIASVTIAQANDSAKIYRIGIFANLFLDSSFTEAKYKYDNQMPRNILPGLDFAEGAMMAFDSIKNGNRFQVFIYDVRSASQNIAQLKKQNSFDSLDLMIGAVAGTEYKQLSDIAFQKNIPFVSATYPNDGGVTNNPYTIVVNSTLPVHCEAIYNFVLRNYATANILYLRKKGPQEDRLASYFENFNKTSKGGQLLNWKMIAVTDSVPASLFFQSLDSERVNIIIAGSLDEHFGTQVLNNAYKYNKKYQLQMIGMPTWETLKDIANPEWKDFAIYYSSTFHNNNSAKWTHFTKTFADKTFGRASDLAFRGFDLSYLFSQLLLKYGNQLTKNLNDKSFRWFLDYDFKPVTNKTSGKPDYYENKRIYILKRSNGLVSRMN